MPGTAPQPRSASRSLERNAVTSVANRHPAFKFLVGIIAGLCAAFGPKVMVYLEYGDSQTLQIFTMGYLAVGVAFAIFIGFLTVLFDWNKRSKPANLFMMALGIPAAVCGSLSTLGTASELDQAEQKRQATLTFAAQELGVPVSVQESPTVTTPRTVAPSPAKSGALWDLFPSAEAAELSATERVLVADGNPPQFGVQAVRSAYYVVLFSSSDRSAAIAKADALRSQVPGARCCVQSGSLYAVTTHEQPVTETDALTEALQLRKQGQQPSLLKAATP